MGWLWKLLVGGGTGNGGAHDELGSELKKCLGIAGALSFCPERPRTPDETAPRRRRLVLPQSRIAASLSSRPKNSDRDGYPPFRPQSRGMPCPRAWKRPSAATRRIKLSTSRVSNLSFTILHRRADVAL